MTKEAERLASEGAPMERIKVLIAGIRHKARVEQEGLRGDPRQKEPSIPTRFELCMIGIREEFHFGRTSVLSMVVLSARFGRVREEIDRTIKEINARQPAAF
jgi:hypothetical protein